MAYESILNADGIARITLNRPDRLNSSRGDAWRVRDALAKVGGDRGVRVLLLTGAGRGFCAGRTCPRAVAPGDAPATWASRSRATIDRWCWRCALAAARRVRGQRRRRRRRR
jgi:enoyl-CoA hydratase/carnithine racemase